MSTRNPVSNYRRKTNRCQSIKQEQGAYGKRSWRCQLVNGHKGKHESSSGHRTWENI